MSELVEAFLLLCIPPESTFVEARQKFAKQFPTAMRDLWQRLVEHAVQLLAKSLHTIGGLQSVAVDGTWVWAPHEAVNIARWG
jgi:hypothetical protein